MKQDDIHIGRLIQDKLKEDGRSPSWLAQKIHCDRTNVYKIFKRSNIDANMLLHISIILGHDFFSHYSQFIREPEKEENESVDISAT